MARGTASCCVFWFWLCSGNLCSSPTDQAEAQQSWLLHLHAASNHAHKRCLCVPCSLCSKSNGSVQQKELASLNNKEVTAGFADSSEDTSQGSQQLMGPLTVAAFLLMMASLNLSLSSPSSLSLPSLAPADPFNGH